MRAKAFLHGFLKLNLLFILGMALGVITLLFISDANLFDLTKVLIVSYVVFVIACIASYFLSSVLD